MVLLQFPLYLFQTLFSSLCLSNKTSL
jgi:hypothetical protein